MSDSLYSVCVRRLYGARPGVQQACTPGATAGLNAGRHISRDQEQNMVYSMTAFARSESSTDQTALVGAGLAAGKGRHAVNHVLLLISGYMSPGIVLRQSRPGYQPVVPRGGPRIIAAHTRCTRNPT